MHSERRFVLLALLVFAALVSAFHGPGLHDPLGCLDQNGGWYFGVTSRTFHDIGFSALRGAPVWIQMPSGAADAVVYLHHPPLWFWTCALFGSSEAALRVPGIVASVAAALAALLILRQLMGRAAALGGAVLLLGLPVLRAHCVVSYEPAVIALGLWFLVATRAGWRALQLGIAAVAPCVDLGFAGWCLGAGILATDPPWRTSLRRLVAPGLLALFSVGAWLGWRHWATQAPGLRTDLPALSLTELFRLTKGSRPELGSLARDGLGILVDTTSVAVCVASALGALVALRRDPRFVGACLLPGLAWPLAFAAHAATHAQFWAYLAASLALCAGALGALRPPGAPWIGAMTVWILAAIPWAVSRSTMRANATPFFRDVGLVAERAAGGGAVTTNSLSLWPYYADGGSTLSAPLLDPATLEELRGAAALPQGYAYLWLEDAALRVDETTRARLERFLAPFPKVRVPELEVTVGRSRGGPVHDIRRAWLVRVPPRRP